jgi:hypothetical protein
VYLGTARLQMADLDGAVEAIRPIVDLPAERRISWIVRCLRRFADLLRSDVFKASPLARDTAEEIYARSA